MTLLACTDDIEGVHAGAEAPGPWGHLATDPFWTSADGGVGTGVGWGDLDADGDPDLVVAYGNDMEPGHLVLYANDDGQLDESPSWESTDAHYFGHLAVGDMDGDGWLDIAVSVLMGDEGWTEPGGVLVFRNENGELGAEPSWSFWGAHTFSLSFGDVENDGDLDLAVAVGEAYFHEPDRSLLFENDGEGEFAEVWRTERDRHTMDVTWADFDQDGWLDLALANIGSGHVVYRNVEGVLADEPAWEAPGQEEDFEGNTLDWGDANGDGMLDLAVSENHQLGGAGQFRVFCGRGAAWNFDLCWESEDEPPYPSALSFEDVDGDGWVDLVGGSWWGAVRVYRNLSGCLAGTPNWTSGDDSLVAEGFAWADADGSHWNEHEWQGTGLAQVPGRGRVLWVEGGVTANGWVSGPGAWSAAYLVAGPRDLAVTNWNEQDGDMIFGR